MKNFILLLISILYTFSLYSQEPVQLVHEKKYYTDISGKLYAPCVLPVYLSISSEPEGKGLNTQLKEDESNPPMYLSEGKNTICNSMSVSSPGGTRESKKCYDVYGDNSSPVTKISFDKSPKYKTKDAVYFGKGLEIYLEANDKLSGLDKSYISLKNFPYQEYNNVTPGLTDGNYIIYFYSVDNVGNVEEPDFIEIFVDFTSPATEYSFNGSFIENKLNSETTITLIAKDNISGIDNIFYQIDNSTEQKYSKPISISELSPGEHKLHYYSIDNVENKEIEKELIFIHDTEQPDVQILVQGNIYEDGKTVFSGLNPKITISATDTVSGIKSIRYELNGENAKEYSSGINLPGTRGLQRVIYYADDNVDNQSKKQIKNIYLDLTVPKTYYRTTKSSFWSNDTLIISQNTGIIFTATDTESGVKECHIVLSGKDIILDNDTLYIQKEGMYDIVYYSTDNVGNKEQNQNLLIKVVSDMIQTDAKDNPENKIWLISDDKLIGSTNLPFYIRISDSPEEGAKSYLAFVPNEKDDNKITESLIFKKNGVNQISIEAAGGKQKFEVKIDGVSPQTKATYSGAEKYVSKGTIYFGSGLKVSLKSLENTTGIISGYENTFISINGGDFAKYSEELDIFGREQKYVLKYYAVDSVQNKEKTLIDSFYIDITPPITVAEFAKSNYGNVLSKNSQIKLKVSDNLCGIDKTIYRFDDSSIKTYNNLISGSDFGSLSEGKHTLYYYSVDNVGNKEQEQSLPIIIDHTPPEIDLIVQGTNIKRGNTIFISKNCKLSLSANEQTTEIDEITYNIGNVEKKYSGKIEFPKVNGNYLLRYSVTDRVLNTNNQSVNIYVDDTDPQTNISISDNVFVLEGQRIVSSKTNILLSAYDGESGVKTIYYNSGAGNRPYSSPISLTGNGKTSLRYYSVDNIGNQENVKTEDFVVDNTSPELRITISPNVQADANGVYKISPFTMIYASATDETSGISGIFVTQNNGSKEVYRKPVSGFNKGENIEIEFDAIDRVGNITVKKLILIVE